MVLVTNFGTSSNASSALRYGANKKKLGYTIPFNCSKDNAIRDFNLSYNINNREDDSVKLHRFVLSFANDNHGKSELNQYDSGEYVRDFMNRLSDRLDNNVSMIAYEHLDKSHNHYHIYLNSVGLDGSKIKPNQSLLYLSRNINDDLAKDYRLKPIQSYRQNYKKQFTTENRARFAKKHNGYEPYSYYADARQKISRGILSSRNLSEFNRNMINQNCGVESNFFKDTKTGSVDIQYRHKNWNLEPDRMRKVRTRTLGADFEKDKIKQAISNPSKESKLIRRYRFYSQKKKSVQGGKMSNIDVSLKNTDEMKGVPYHDQRLNSVAKVKSNATRIGKNSEGVANNTRKIKGNSIKLSNQESNRRKNQPKIKGHERSSQSTTSVMKPDLNGMSQLEREQVLEDEKFMRNLFQLADDLMSSFQSISLNRSSNQKHHKDTLSSFKRRYYAQEVQFKKQREHQHESRMRHSSDDDNHIISNIERERYNKIHSNINKRKGPHYR